MGEALFIMREDGWPYPDDDDDDVDEQLEPIDPGAEVDDDLVALHALPRRAVAGLTPVERTVIARRFGFDGQPPCTVSQLHDQLGLPRREVRQVLVEGLTKLRGHLTC
jgi:DNA-directed RNA polymerase sigma subunit (sigma70/sigma32)